MVAKFNSAFYRGQVDFGEWSPEVHNVKDMAALLQSTFEYNDENYMCFSEDGKSIEFEMTSLGNGSWPTFRASLEAITESFVFWNTEDSEELANGGRNRLKNLSEELRRIADMVEQAANVGTHETHVGTHEK